MKDTTSPSILYEKTKIDLSSELPKVRKTRLEELLDVISNPTSCEDRDIIFNILKLVIRCFEDTSESCRELSVRIVLSFLDSWSVTGENAIFVLLPVIQKRLCVEQPGETSEQIRLLLIELVTTLVNKYPNNMTPFAEKIINIMVLGFGDPSPDVKKNMCTCASVVAKTLVDFRQHSDTVISAILPVLKHKHYRIRVAAVNALSDIVMFGHNGCVEQVCGALGEKLLDQNAHVRGAILRTVALWCRKLQDRYSRFHYLLPLILSGLSDENDQYREEAKCLWHEIGIQYAEENEKLKHDAEYLPKELENYPINVERPNLGCRTLVQNEMGKIVAALMKELEDWIPEVRIKSSALLIDVALHAEETTVTFLEQMLPTLYRAVSDTENEVSRNVLKAVEMMSYFVPSKMYWSLLVSHIKESQSVGKYAVLASLLKYRPKAEISNQLSEIVSVLAEDDICQTNEIANLKYLLAIVSKLIDCCENLECDEKIVINLYSILICVMAANESVQECATELMEKLFKTVSQSELRLNELCLLPIMERLRKDCDMWESHSTNYNIFIILLSRFPDNVIELVPDTILQILTAVLVAEGDKEMIFKILRTVAELLNDESRSHSRIEFVRKIIADPLRPQLIWRPGRLAEVIRATALSIVLLFLRSVDTLDDDFITRTVPIILSLCEDAYDETRLYALESIALVGKHLKSNDCEIFYSMLTCIGGRLDDKLNTVRMKALQTLRTVLINAPPNAFEAFSKVENVSKALSLIFLYVDDDDRKIKESVLDFFKEESVVACVKKIFDKKTILTFLDRCCDKNLASMLEKYLNI